jgi:hypothetical protein
MVDTRPRDSTSINTCDVSVSNIGRDSPSPDSITSTVDTELVFTRTGAHLARAETVARAHDEVHAVLPGVATWEVKKIQVAAAVFRFPRAVCTVCDISGRAIDSTGL